MNKIKGFLSVLVCMAMLCAALPAMTVGAEELSTCGDNLTWTLDSEGTLTISGTGDMTDWDWSGSPWYYERTEIKTVIIESGVTSIGEYAFFLCQSLTSIAIPSGVTIIGDYAFCGCNSLADISIPSGVTSVGECAFADCIGLTAITIPDGVMSIGQSAFEGCKGITSVTISDGVTTIGTNAFNNCAGITSVIIPAAVTSIGEYAFSGCYGLTSFEVDSANSSYASVDGILFNKEMTKLIQYPAKKPDTEYAIPDGVISIGNEAFCWCVGLTDIDIPDSVTSIGSEAFFGCNGFTGVSIGSSVTSIGECAFRACDGLTGIEVDVANPSYTSVDGVLFDKGMTKLIQYPERKPDAEYVISDGVTGIGKCAFEGNRSLTNVTIPHTVTSIGDDAFSGCYGLTGVTIPTGVTSIGEWTFNLCTDLTSVIIPATVTNIGYKAFYKCDSLTDVYYSGSEEEWSAISIEGSNGSLTSATIHYNSAGPVPEITGVKLTTETDAETDAEIITVTVETEDVFSNNALLAVGFGDSGVISVSAIENGEAVLPAEGVKTVKVFAWESMESMKPLCAAKTVTAQ